MVDYRSLRLSNVTQPRFRHVLLLLYWPFHGLMFLLLERGGLTSGFTPIWCPLDDLIPFCEWFFIPYVYWFVFLIGGLAWSFFCDVKAFRRMMQFIIVTYGITLMIYILWPTCQNLRPESFPRDNFMTRIIAWFYAFDTNTNVCPSMHVLGSVAVPVGLWYSEKFRTPMARFWMVFQAALISISTVFVKQHSAVDVLSALPLCLFAILLMNFMEKRHKKAKPLPSQKSPAKA